VIDVTGLAAIRIPGRSASGVLSYLSTGPAIADHRCRKPGRRAFATNSYWREPPLSVSCRASPKTAT